ncbi:aminopeptidase [Comamonas testosteroni]|uniref:Aminopeptidase n=1 Tax=Comamonas testosteroni TaxID=285 RepID=A0A373FNM6_COMTE|nr:aminopeptidase [Comamonas testosteroni]RGE45771.1 aminopeptidase [Comamonas testosteroni]
MQKRTSVVSLAAIVAIGGAMAALGGCSSTAYYWQGFKGQMQIMQAARPVDDWLNDSATPPALQQRLRAAQKMRRFASDALALPDNASYTRYAALERKYAVWNVVAAPPDSLKMHRWCFPITGCISYRGYFAESDARAEADEMQAQGYEVSVYGVPAYSTLGYLNWLGGDPLLSTFVEWQEGDFAGLLFHELAHQLIYVKDDTAFNESFAMTVEAMATPLWLQNHASDATLKRWQQAQQRRKLWQQLTRGTRSKLEEVYEQHSLTVQNTDRLSAIKSEVFNHFRTEYARLRAQWIEADEPLLTSDSLRQRYYERLAQTDDWVAHANNASFGALAAYDDWVPAMSQWWKQLHQGQQPSPESWKTFYAQMRELSKLPAAERTQRLCALVPADGRTPAACSEKKSE